MIEQNPVRAFINRRWADAKHQLDQDAPSYLDAVELYKAVSTLLFLPQQLKPSKPLLTTSWVTLLETTVTVALAMEDLKLTATLMQGTETRRAAHWYLDMWYQNAFNLLEHAKVMITLTCKVNSLGDLDKKYHAQIDDKAGQGRISELRHPLVHGAGEPGTVVNRAITEDERHSWEYYAAIGPEVIQEMLEYEPKGGLTPQALHKMVAGLTTTLIARTGNVLDTLESDIAKYTQQP